MKPSFPKLAGAFVLLMIAVYALFALRTGIPALAAKRQAIHELEKSNASLAREIEHQREHINRLRDNQAEQELEIRQRLKLVRPGEKVFVLQDQQEKKTP